MEKAPAHTDLALGARDASQRPCAQAFRNQVLSANSLFVGQAWGFLWALLLNSLFWEICPWDTNKMEAEIARSEMKGESSK